VNENDQIGEQAEGHDVSSNESRFRADGLELFYRSWKPALRSRALIVIAHGIGEHSGRYERYVQAFLARGFAVYALDHRGHGRSPGQRGHVDSWVEYRSDLGAFLAFAGALEPDAPAFLLGHSMGALIALDFALESDDRPQDRLSGLILSGTPLEPVGVAKPWLVLVAKVLSRVRPRTSLKPDIDPDTLSRDPEVVRVYAEDPLVHHHATARWGIEALDTIALIKRRPVDLRVPLMVVHGGADQVNSPEGSRALVERASSPDKTLRIYEGARHEPHNDRGWQRVVADVAGWIEARL
jgi:alpha-beta hydrolase superfamily lysophospholipase